jgi:hypothetical protein
MMAYPHAETAGGRKAPRQEIAGVEAGTGLRGYGDLSVGSILGVVGLSLTRVFVTLRARPKFVFAEGH